MAYQNNNYGWGSMREIYEPAYHPRHHHQKRHVAIYDEPIVETNQPYYVQPRREIETDQQDTRYGGRNYNTCESVDSQDARFVDRNYNTYETVDQEADAFIQHEHRRMEMARLVSSMKNT